MARLEEEEARALPMWALRAYRYNEEIFPEALDQWESADSLKGALMSLDRGLRDACGYYSDSFVAKPSIRKEMADEAARRGEDVYLTNIRYRKMGEIQGAEIMAPSICDRRLAPGDIELLERDIKAWQDRW